MAELYLGGVESYHGPLEDRFDRLPPLLVQVGSAETLLDDAVRLSAAAERDGVDVILEKWGAMVHVWHYFAQILPEGQEAVDRMGLFIRQHTL